MAHGLTPGLVSWTCDPHASMDLESTEMHWDLGLGAPWVGMCVCDPSMQDVSTGWGIERGGAGGRGGCVCTPAAKGTQMGMQDWSADSTPDYLAAALAALRAVSLVLNLSAMRCRCIHGW